MKLLTRLRIGSRLEITISPLIPLKVSGPMLVSTELCHTPPGAGFDSHFRVIAILLAEASGT